jgi:hypothetical protein
MASMQASKAGANLEFLEFLADISNPATGEISASRLADWLCQTEAGLKEKWHKCGANIPWWLFADEVLAVLDAAQDQVHDLGVAIDWYLSKPLDGFGMNTPQQVVVDGKARQLVVAIKGKEVPVP